MNSLKIKSEASPISALILDLDGTLLNTENASKGVMAEFLAKFGKELDTEKQGNKRVGMTLQATAAVVIQDYDLPLTPDQFIQEILPLYRRKWSQAAPMPGADKLIRHLYKHKVPFALASNSLRDYIEEKISCQKGWKDCFSVILGSDQVKSGKPAPDLFLEAAKEMGVHPSECLVIEDSLVGVKAAIAAKMKVVAVPSPGESDCSNFADSIISSLTEFRPEKWGLPSYDDCDELAVRFEKTLKSDANGHDGVLELEASDEPLIGVVDKILKPEGYGSSSDERSISGTSSPSLHAADDACKLQD